MNTKTGEISIYQLINKCLCNLCLIYLFSIHESELQILISLGSTFHAEDASTRKLSFKKNRVQTWCKQRQLDCFVLWSCVSQLKNYKKLLKYAGARLCIKP